MNKILTIILICVCSFCYTKMNAQCGTTINSGVCYNSTGGLQTIAVDICPDTPTDIVSIAFTAGSIENCCDEVVVYTGATGTGTGGTELHNASQGSGDLTGLTIAGTVAGECLHVYINADGSVDCGTEGGIAPVIDVTCAAGPTPGGCLNPAVVTPVCTEVSITFSAGTDQMAASVANPSVGYGCLSTSPNPAWYYLEIDATGTLSFDISNSNSLDVDWAAWGPFIDLADINADCGSGAAPFNTPVDCDYTSAGSGVMNLGTVNAGEVYAVLVTNFSNNPTDISMSTTAGSSATTDCAILPPDGYWINSTAPAAGNWGTCPYPVITDASGTMYDQFGPSSPTPAGQSQVVTVCPDGAATVDLTINYNMQDPLSLGDELVAIFDDKSRNNGLNEIANLSGTGTNSYTTTGPCFTILYQPKGGAGFQIDWSVNTAGAGTTFVQGDMCEDAFLITDANTPLAMSAVGATSGPVYNAGAIVSGTDCDPDLITDGCTTTVENTVYAKFTSCAAGGSATLTLATSTCNSTGETPQVFLYTGTCGAHTFVDCVSSLAAGGSPTLTATLAANTEYTIVIDGFRGIECDFTVDVTGCLSTAAVTCADCLETACATAPVFADFTTSDNNYTGASPNGWPTGNEIDLGSFNPDDNDGEFITVCTDIAIADIDADFMGFDQFLNYTDGNGDNNSCATRSIAVYQEVGGACNLLTPTSINPYGVPEFDNPLGTTYDPAIEITVCVTYTDDAGGCTDALNNSTVVAYGCAAVTGATAGTQSACNLVDDTYTQDVVITWNTANLPSPEGDGTRNITVNGTNYNVSTADINAGTTTITLTGLTADGNAVDVVAAFTRNSGCEMTVSSAFTAPVACSVTCTPNAGTISTP